MWKKAALLLLLVVGFAVHEEYSGDANDYGEQEQDWFAQPQTRVRPGAPSEAASSLQTRQGSYFRYAVPPNWRANETTNGVDVIAPDGHTGTNFILLMGGFGGMTPNNFIVWRLQSMGLSDVRWLYQPKSTRPWRLPVEGCGRRGNFHL